MREALSDGWQAMPGDAETIAGMSAEGLPVTHREVSDALAEMVALLALKTVSGHCSARFLAQLARHWCRLPQMFGDRELLIDVHAVADQIGVMEGSALSRAIPTKPATEFTAGLLAGLWHKHWFQAGFLLENLALENDQNGLYLLHKGMRRRFGPRPFDGRRAGREEVAAVTHAAVFDAIEHRAGAAARRKVVSRLTGEWIVFARSKGKNIYLTLACHAESNEAILARCVPSVKEFPELLSQAPFSELRNHPGD